MIYKSDKAQLKRYRHLIAALIAYSIGYFTPLAALQAIKDFKNNTPNFCEWFLDIAWKRGLDNNNAFLEINRDIIKDAIKYRHCSDFKFALDIVDENIAGNESLGASWF
ncbi:MAG: hypothetical protein IJQ82_04880 [Selenomonadaceae bacterium]|nr:hypothetical protein [Selenomonadaceae bacterium]